MKKIFFLIASFFFFVICFYEQIAGWVICAAVRRTSEMELAYRSISWKGKKITFSDLVLFDPAFHAHVEKVELQLDLSSFPKKLKGHLAIEKPYVSFIKQRKIPEVKEGWLDLTAEVQEGILEWNGLAQFSLKKDSLESYLNIDWGESGVIVKTLEGQIEADFRKFRIELLKSIFPYGEIVSGAMSGRILLSKENELMMAHLKVGQIGIKTPFAKLETLDGTLSYNAQLGAKWEFEGLGFAQGQSHHFSCQGRGFFKSRWMESQVVFDDASFKIEGTDTWSIKCESLTSGQLCLLKSGAVVLWPELATWNLAQGLVSGEGKYSSKDSWSLQFEGQDLLMKRGDFEIGCKKAVCAFNEEGGYLEAHHDPYHIHLKGLWKDWRGEISFPEAFCRFQGGWEGQKCPIEIVEGSYKKFDFKGKGWIDSSLDLFLNLSGNWTFANRKIPFSIPVLNKVGGDWLFDFRFTRAFWDFARLKGSYNGEEIVFDPQCHFLTSPIVFNSSKEARFELRRKSLFSLSPLLEEWGIPLEKIPHFENLGVSLKVEDFLLCVQAKSSDLDFKAEETKEGWLVDLHSDLLLKGKIGSEGEIEGHFAWKKEMEGDFLGKVAPDLGFESTLSNFFFHLPETEGIEGEFLGEGKLIYKNGLAASFDLAAKDLRIRSEAVSVSENFRFYYSSHEGARFENLRLHGPFECSVDLVEFDLQKSHWIFHQANISLPVSLLPQKFARFLDQDQKLQFTSDLDFTSDFSSFVCTVREGFVPLNHQTHLVKDAHLYWNHKECKAAFRYSDWLYRVSLYLDDKMKGKLILGEEENPLTIDWEYTDRLNIHSIEGSFAGVESSFHAESEETLIGSARVDFKTLRSYIPEAVARAFEEVKLGKGYELKGRLTLKKNSPVFQGILSGKQLELFGFQFRTLLAQVDLGFDHVKIYDLKISDTAGMMKIDQLLLQSVEENPWTIQAGQISIHEFRPSLLQRPNGPVGPISPLVVRELKLNDLKGMLDDGKTYTAKGKLHFINSYKREETVFDLPANVLSRIVGLDLELLIPVCGDLTFNLKDGYFNLLELKNAFSEASRSEFFLEMEPPPRMDLDGNLKIFVKMKQFVLLKITESFLISIEGQIDDPEFSLKRKGYFGLM